MNTETDRDLTTEEQEQLSGGLFFRMTFQGSLRTSSCMTPPLLSRPREPKSAGVRHGIFADFRDCPSPANQLAPAFRLPAGRQCG